MFMQIFKGVGDHRVVIIYLPNSEIYLAYSTNNRCFKLEGKTVSYKLLV